MTIWDVCKDFNLNGNQCIDVLTSHSGNELTLDIVDLIRECKRSNYNKCNKENIFLINNEEKSFWKCIDALCNGRSDYIIKMRKKNLDKLNKSFKSLLNDPFL